MPEQRVDDLLERIEVYYDAVPRTAARAEDHGPLTLFVNERPGWDYYARPRLRAPGPIQTADVAAVRARQRALGVPEAFEWVAEVTPSLRDPIERSGLRIHELTLMVLDGAMWESARDPASSPAGISAQIVEPDSADLAMLRAVADVGFGSPGTQVGTAGRKALAGAAERQDPVGLSVLRERLRTGLTVMAAAGDAGGPLAVGSHQPVGGVTEVLGVATLPAARRRGLCTAITRALVTDALRGGCGLVFLSADGDDVARLYARTGFRPIGRALVAEPFEPPAGV